MNCAGCKFSEKRQTNGQVYCVKFLRLVLTRPGCVWFIYEPGAAG